MNYDNDVCTLEQAEKLKRLGVKQESAYYWRLVEPEKRLMHRDEVCSFIECGNVAHPSLISHDVRIVPEYYASAFNTGELIAMLGYLDEGLHLSSGENTGKYFGSMNKIDFTISSKNISEMLAYHLLELVKATILDVEGINRRLDEFHGVTKEGLK